MSDSFGEACATLGSITSYEAEFGASSIDTDTIAGETTSNSAQSKNSSANIDVVGLAVFRNDVLVRRTNCN